MGATRSNLALTSATCRTTTTRLLAVARLHSIIFLLHTLSSYGQADYPLLRSGDLLFKGGAYTEAETQYRKALEEKQKPTSNYNLGNSIYEQNRMTEAAESYKKAIAGTSDPQLKSNAWFNLGNTYFQQQNFAESIKAYKEALKSGLKKSNRK